MIELAVKVTEIEEVTFLMRKVSVFDFFYFFSQVNVPEEQIRRVYHHAEDLNHVGFQTSKPLQLLFIPIFKATLPFQKVSLLDDVFADQCFHYRTPKERFNM